MTPPATPLRVSLLWATPDRAAAIADVHRALFPEPWDIAAIVSLLERPGATSLIAEAGEPRALAGFVIGQIAADEAEVISIGVAPAAQRRGIARQLLEGLIRAAKRAEAKRLYLEVAEDNAPALALYRRLGFAETGRRKGYYTRRAPASAADAVVMTLVL